MRKKSTLSSLLIGLCFLSLYARAESKSADAEGHEWWQHAVFYEIYPRSFADSNNDGIGDL
jgi:alpha-glucosidase